MNIILSYFYWQIILTPKKLILIIKDFIIFGIDFFSIKETLRTLFSPWRRSTCDYGRGFDFQRYFEAFSSNLIARILGFIMRLFLLFFFALYETIVLIVGPIVLLVFLLYPFLAIFILFKLL
ncbi:MAG: hypothetical protein WC909_00715 [Candidatus Paceibacterota bacterium]